MNNVNVAPVELTTKAQIPELKEGSLEKRSDATAKFKKLPINHIVMNMINTFLLGLKYQ